jgi:transcriptional regulator with PAS, ATPase and Fis domain
MIYDLVSSTTTPFGYDSEEQPISGVLSLPQPSFDAIDLALHGEQDQQQENDELELSLNESEINPPVSNDCVAPIARPRSMKNVVGEAHELIDVFSVVDRVADTNCTVLITGDSGTGKELVAQAVHNTSSRANGPFVTVNCGAIPETLLESELFGHAKGAFTGATASKLGRIGMANRGTLFLDEIGELPLSLQVKLLRVLQAHEYSPVGDNRTLKADVRVVAATNIDLEDAVAKGTFRQDLYYRLNVIHLQMPALRRRAADIPKLVEHFMAIARNKTGRNVREVSRAAMQLLATYSWPGNVRELENTIERAMLRATREPEAPGFGARSARRGGEL